MAFILKPTSWVKMDDNLQGIASTLKAAEMKKKGERIFFPYTQNLAVFHWPS